MKLFNNFSRLVPWFTAMSLGVLMAGCGGGADQAPILGSAGTVATVAPFVTVVSPLPGATGVPVNTKKITAAFSKPMDGASLTATSFTLSCPGTVPVAGTAVAYTTAGSIATLTIPATSALPASTLCTATVTSAAKDTAGVALTSNFSWNFTTGVDPDTIAPTVTHTVNANGATNVTLNTAIGATFSEAINPATITGAQYTMKESLSGSPVAGVVSYAGVSTEFKPSAILTPSTRYTLTIKGAAGGVTDTAGNAMVNDYVWSWTTGLGPDTTAPTVIATINANGAVNVPVNTKVGATFSEPIAVASLTNANFSLTETNSGAVVAGIPSYSGVNSVFIPLTALSFSTNYTGRIKGGATGVKDLAGNAMVNDYVWSWTTSAAADTTAPTIIVVNPADLATNVAVTSSVNATFNEAMDPLTMNTANFSVAGITGLVGYDAISRVMTYTPSISLAPATTYTATVSTGVRDIAGNAMTANKVWSFMTASAVVIPPVSTINLGSVGTYGTFGGTAGMTNMGILTLINGNIGTTATGTSSITGFHDTAGDIYTQTGSNAGSVNGLIRSCTNSTTGPTSAGVNAASCALATQARLDAQSAYLALVAMPPGANPGANLAGLTLAPGVYTSPSGSFLIEGADLTLDAQGNANAVFVFQMATTLTVGGPGAAFPRSIILAGGAQAKNVFWQVGSFATINAGGGGTMVGTILAQAGVSVSTAGNVNIVTLNGRALSLGASVTLVNTVINVP